MTKKAVDNSNKRLKQYLVDVRVKLILAAAGEHDLNFSDVARIFKMDKAEITRTISANMDAFKGYALNKR